MKKKPNALRTNCVHIYVDKKQYERILAMTQKKGISISSLVRDVVVNQKDTHFNGEGKIAELDCLLPEINSTRIKLQSLEENIKSGSLTHQEVYAELTVILSGYLKVQGKLKKTLQDILDL